MLRRIVAAALLLGTQTMVVRCASTATVLAGETVPGTSACVNAS